MAEPEIFRVSASCNAVSIAACIVVDSAGSGLGTATIIPLVSLRCFDIEYICAIDVISVRLIGELIPESLVKKAGNWGLLYTTTGTPVYVKLCGG